MKHFKKFKFSLAYTKETLPNDEKFFVDFDRYKTLKKILPKEITAFDVGANIGQTIMEISKHFPKSSIHCFEPMQECQEDLIYLKNNLNSVNINLNFNAVGAQIKKKIFYANIQTEYSSFIKINTKPKLFINNKKKYLKVANMPRRVNQITLSSYLKKKNINNIDVLKVDTQGYEDQVLKGIYPNDLNKFKTIVLEMMFWDLYKQNISFLEIEKLIGKYFKLWDISYIYKNPKYNSTDYIDTIYVNKLFLKNFLNKR